MKRQQLTFSNASDAWDFLAFTKISNVDVQKEIIIGFFSESDISIAQNEYGAKIKDAPAVENTPAPRQTEGNEITLIGKSGNAYTGTIYSKHDQPAHLPAQAIVCLTNSSRQYGDWQHNVNAIYQTDDAAEEINRFKERGDISQIIIIPNDPAEKSKVDKVDDLTRNYIHRQERESNV